MKSIVRHFSFQTTFSVILRSVQTEYDRVRLINMALEKQLGVIKSTPAFTIHELNRKSEELKNENVKVISIFDERIPMISLGKNDDGQC